ncbi:unnamed protein product [Danaus chrysippus]|uniref:Oligomycin sensitivity conferral protein n=1 Tax=Danaus chrysippus TaxID=151541 RepID=A0A8J2RAM7_9NEOP|nr:unnamed protein product [Danaus chrysippus]
MLRIFIRRMCSTPKTISTPIPVFGVEGRYVAALYSAASQMSQLDEVEKSLRSLLTELDKPKVRDFCESSMISSAEKSKLLQEVGEQTGMPKATINFLGLVSENGRLKMLKKMINLFNNVMVAHRNEALCEVITAKALDDTSRKALVDALKKFVKGDKKIQMTEKVDPTIIGGVIVGIEDKHIDLSISRKLQMYTDLLKQSI